MGVRGSLGHGFPLAPLDGRGTIRPAFGLVLYGGFLTPLSRPLDPADIFSAGCRPSQTAHLPVFPFGLASRDLKAGVSSTHPSNLAARIHSSPLPYTSDPSRQRQAAVKLHGVPFTHRESLAFSPGWCVQGAPTKDSGGLVTPFAKSAFNRQGITLP